jgi:hypothetical protein
MIFDVISNDTQIILNSETHQIHKFNNIFVTSFPFLRFSMNLYLVGCQAQLVCIFFLIFKIFYDFIFNLVVL